MLCVVLLFVACTSLTTHYKLQTVRYRMGPDLSGPRPVYVYWWIVRFRLCGHKSFTSSLFDSISLLHFCNVRLRSKVSESRFSGPELGSYRLSPLHVNVFCFQLPTPCYCFQYEIFFNNAVSLRLLFLHACNICLILMIFIFYKPTCTCIDDLCNEFLSQLYHSL